MIVEERCGEFVNVYVDGFVFTADTGKRVWGFGDGDDSDERREREAAARGMTKDAFVAAYTGICNAATGWDDPRWTYRYHIAAMNSQGTLMQEEIMDRVEQAIERNKVWQDRDQCREMLKRYASMGMIRQFGLCIMKYISDREDGKRSRIVYRMADLSPSELSALVPEKVLGSAIHRSGTA